MIGYVALLPATVWLAADDATPSGGGAVIDALLKGGPFAVVLLLIVLDKLGTNSERDRLRAENAELRKQNQMLNDTIRTDLIPPLTENNRLQAETLNILSDLDRFPVPPRKRPPTKRS